MFGAAETRTRVAPDNHARRSMKIEQRLFSMSTGSIALSCGRSEHMPKSAWANRSCNQNPTLQGSILAKGTVSNGSC